MIRKFALAAALPLCMSIGSAQAEWPEQPITLVVPFSAGGISDIITRVTAESLREILDSPVVVENRVGAGGIIAAEEVVKSTPDGYTVFAGTVTQIAVAPYTSVITYDPIQDYVPVSLIGTSPFVITISADLPADTLEEFIEYAKERPGELSYGASGHGAMSHLSAAVFLEAAELEMTMVPYGGIAPAFTDLLAGNIQMVSATPVELKAYLEEPEIKILAQSGGERSPALPDVPLIADTIPGHAVETWNGLLVPAGTPQEVVNKLADAMKQAHESEIYVQRLREVGIDPVYVTPEEMAKMIVADTERWSQIVPKLGIEPQ